MTDIKYLSVKNWDSFQHYKDRSPPWIKLHRDLLRDYDFSCLQDASKLLLMLLWLLASQLDNKIPADMDFIKKQTGISGKVDLNELIQKGFVIDASNALAKGKQVAIAETETEIETEAETETEYACFDLYNSIAFDLGLSVVQVRTDKRKKALRERLRECGGIEGWKACMEKVKESRFLSGDNKTAWKADFDFIVTKSKFIKIMEGAYDNKDKPNFKKQQLKEMHADGW